MASEQGESSGRLARHVGCHVCAGQTRPRAYRWLGEAHWIPGTHGAHWLGDDLRIAIGSLAVEEQIVLDYCGEVEGAPRIVLRRGVDDVISARDLGGRGAGVRWTWEPAVDSVSRIERIAIALLGYLRELRDARGVTLVEPHAR